MDSFLEPSEAQAATLMAKDPNQPLAVLNIFKFNDKAQYTELDPEYGTALADVSGREAYQRYAESAGAKLNALGGSVRYSAAVEQILIGPPDASWDLTAVMLFPSRAAFLQMLTDPEFQATSRHRKAALENHYMIHLDGTTFT